MDLPPRSDVAGTPISVTTYDEVLDLLDQPVGEDRARTYAFCNVHSVMTARQDPELAAVLQLFDVATPDGMPLVWWLRATGHDLHDRVYGPDLMEMALRHGVSQGWRHYFYGATDSTLAALQNRSAANFPGVIVAGMSAPPFRPSTEAELTQDLQAIDEAGATHVWVGLGMPKQELWVDAGADRLAGRHVLAVGAAFDFLAGTVAQAPDWMQDRGLEWAHRFAKEPRRLAGRYLRNNPEYLRLLAQAMVKHRTKR